MLIQLLAQIQERPSLTTLAMVGLVILYPSVLYNFLENAYHSEIMGVFFGFWFCLICDLE